MYCLDTSVIIDFLNGEEDTVNKIDEILQKGDVYTTPISLFEIYKGIYLYGQINEEVEIFEKVLRWLPILSFNKEVSNEFGKMYNKLKKKGKLVPEFDLIIASFVKDNNLILITRDKKHFNDVGIKVEKW